MQRVSSRLFLSFAAYLVLLGATVGSTVWVLNKQRDDGLIVNLSGRQRMLTQRMTHQLMTYARLTERAADSQAARSRVLDTMRVFEVTLDALDYGGPAPLDLASTQMRDCPPASAAVKAGIARVREVYLPYRQAADEVLNGSPQMRAIGLSHLVEHNTELLSEMNSVVFLMQNEAEAKVALLYRIQGGTLIAAFLLTLALVLVVHNSITRPLHQLQRVSEELSLGNLHCVVPLDGPQEVRGLATAFERLRMSLHATLGPRIRDRASSDFARL